MQIDKSPDVPPAPEPGASERPRRFGLLCFLLFLLLGFQSLIWFLWWRLEPAVANENGFMENCQAVLLLAGALILAHAAWRAYPGPPWIFVAGLGLLYFTFAMLEVDTRDYDLPRLNFFLHGTVRNLWLGALWATLAILAIRHARSLWGFFRKWLPTCSGIVLSAAGLFWVASRFTEVLELMPGTFFLEEILEINGTILMFIAAWNARTWAATIDNRPETK